MGTVLFTGYYTPIFDASAVRTERFRYPLYKQPPDLEKGFDGKILGRRLADGQLVPYPARAEIERSNMLAGQELYWLADAFEVYIAQVQGSARLRMPDGSLVTAGYAANNGHEYQSVAKALVEDGKIAKGKLSLQAMIDYFRAHPDEVQRYTWLNPRFVFFTASGDEAPRGSLNEPVTPRRTIATDKAIFPRASLTFISTNLPRRTNGDIVIRPYTGFTLDQDTGGAIRAPGRCDVYIGVGDENGVLAGRVFEEGRLYYIFKKEAAAVTPPGP
jgi:membrane-bound lytic murein transglycosylase A